MVGMWLASEVPERVERLVLCCTSAQFTPSEAWEERAQTVRANGVGAIADAVLERWFTPALGVDNPDTFEWAGRMLRETPPEGYAGCCEAIRDADLRDRLVAVRAPTLVVAGADDPAAPPEHGRLIRDSIPNAQLVIVSQARHLANVEQPEEVTRAVMAHLEPVSRIGG
jgi:3-oxoadipate enol-lactonase